MCHDERNCPFVAQNTVFPPPMDLYIAAALAMLVVWAGVTLMTAAPGWIHLLLTAGVFLLIWRIVDRGTPSKPKS